MRPFTFTRIAALSVLAAAALLAGCASTYRLDNTVESFSSLPQLPASPAYRFDRLPSQQAAPQQQGQLEALADGALFRAGLRRDDAAPRYAVQVSANVQRALSPWADPWMGGWGWGGLGGGGRHRGLSMGLGWGGPLPRMEQPWWHREVAVVVRELATSKVVFESRAVNDGPWQDHSAVIAAMFDAALAGFPNPPQGPRRVDVQVGTAAAPAAPPSGTAPPAPR